MASKPKQKMSVEERAKQFMPFAAVKGLDAAMAAYENLTTEKIDLYDETLDELDRKMHMLKKGDIVTIVYFHNKEYLKKTGIVSKFDLLNKYIQIVDTKIYFENILLVDILS